MNQDLEKEPTGTEAEAVSPETPVEVINPTEAEVAENRAAGWKEAVRQKFEAAVSYINGLIKNPEKEKEKQVKVEAKTLAEKAKLLEYRPGQGVVSMVSMTDPKTGETAPILAPDFRDCCGVVLKSDKGIAITHISPYTALDAEVDPSMQFGAMELNDKNYYEHLDKNIKALTSQDQEGKTVLPSMQIIGGQSSMAQRLYNTFGHPAQQLATEFGNYSFPKINAELYSAGKDPKAILASKDNTYICEQAGDQRVWQADEECPFKCEIV